jgi:ParB family transcriptional regulator, chromosome partitioning protein
MTRKALGRGLSALLSAEAPARALDEGLEIDIALIDPNPVQPRSRFDERSLSDLAQSIRENGIVQPVLVRPKGSRYELVAGERRWRAAQKAQLQKIPAVVRDVPDEKLLELALIENIQRDELNAIEEANAYKKLIETVGLTQELLAQRVGRDRSYITNYLRLLRLPEDLQRLVQEGKLSVGHARTLLGASDVAVQRRLARKIVDKGLSVRQIEHILRGAAKRSSEKNESAGVNKDPNISIAETKLRRKLGTQVRILEDLKGTGGRIEIEYYNSQQRDHFYDLLMADGAAASR